MQTMGSICDSVSLGKLIIVTAAAAATANDNKN